MLNPRPDHGACELCWSSPLNPRECWRYGSVLGVPVESPLSASWLAELSCHGGRLDRHDRAQVTPQHFFARNRVFSEVGFAVAAVEEVVTKLRELVGNSDVIRG
jgi:hypothetical protein